MAANLFMISQRISAKDGQLFYCKFQIAQIFSNFHRMKVAQKSFLKYHVNKKNTMSLQKCLISEMKWSGGKLHKYKHEDCFFHISVQISNLIYWNFQGAVELGNSSNVEQS